MSEGVLGGAVEIALWSAIALLAYLYCGYPLTLALLPRARTQPRPVGAGLPTISLLIAAYNEASKIAATLDNKRALDYPADRFEIFVVSDGSTDGTDEIVREMVDRVRTEGTGPPITLLRQEPRAGKTMALNLARQHAHGEIIVFSDANSIYAGTALREIAHAFADPTIGYVTGKLLYLNPGQSLAAAGCGLYMRYENWLRQLETRVGSIVGVNGGIDAVRRSLYQPMRADHLPDFILPLRVVEQGFRVVYAPQAICYEEALKAARDELKMRVRVSLRAYHALAEMRHLLGLRFGRFAFQLLVHKVLRYLAFVPMLVALIANIALVATPIYALMLAAQVAFYGAALIGRLLEHRISSGMFLFPYYFVLVNLGAALAFFKFLRGERQVVWNPRKGA